MKKLFLTLFFLFFYSTIDSYQAVINVPIADLIGSPIVTLRPDNQTETAYKTMATCGAQINSSFACPRLHQLVYNDMVNVIKTNNDEVCISTTHAFYLTPSSSTAQTQYWTLKKNITPLTDITSNNISPEHIPSAITFADSQHTALNRNDVITLKEPHYCSPLKTTFSVGTRFVRVPCTKKKLPSMIEAFAIDYRTMQERRIKIPHNKCSISCTTQTPDEKINNYVSLLKKWCLTKKGCIPYVWGGTSFSHTTPGAFKEVTQQTNNSDYSYYQYEKDVTAPKSGFDCTGVTLRAAQISGIPYFCKNTTTIPHCLKTITPEQTLSPGDLILVRGHVMIVSDTTKNLLIEARSYGHGYGKLHEIPLNEVFEGINTYKDLTDACCNKKVLKRKDKKGKVRDSFSNVQLFSMKSAWDK